MVVQQELQLVVELDYSGLPVLIQEATQLQLINPQLLAVVYLGVLLEEVQAYLEEQVIPQQHLLQEV